MKKVSGKNSLLSYSICLTTGFIQTLCRAGAGAGGGGHPAPGPIPSRVRAAAGAAGRAGRRLWRALRGPSWLPRTRCWARGRRRRGACLTVAVKWACALSLVCFAAPCIGLAAEHALLSACLL